MDYSPDFLSAVAESGICSAYYSLCRDHPLRLDEPLAKAPGAEILRVANGTLQLKSLAGPGTVLQLVGLPEHISLNFIVQGRSSVETDFSVRFGDVIERGTFAVLCNVATTSTGGPVSNPPYPRPNFHSLEELIKIMCRLDTLVRKLGAIT
jgi:hypothetical protein